MFEKKRLGNFVTNLFRIGMKTMASKVGSWFGRVSG